MFQNLGTRNRALLGDVADYYNRYAQRLGIFEQHTRTLTNLTHTACGRFHRVGIDCLNGVDNHQTGIHRLNLGNDVLQTGVGVDVTLLVGTSDTVGADFDLCCRLLTRHIERFESIVGQRELQAEG